MEPRSPGAGRAGFVPPACDLRGRLRARGRRGGLRRRRARAAEVADVLARLAEKSLVAVEEGRPRAALPAARDGSHVCARAARRGRRGDHARSASRRLGALAGRARAGLGAARPRDAEPARRARHAARARSARRAAPLCRAVAVLAASHRARRGPAPVCCSPSKPAPNGRPWAPRRCWPQRRSTSAAARCRPACRSPNEAAPLRPRSATRTANGGRCSFSESSGSPAMRQRSALPWLEQALGLARRERFTAGEAISIHSLGVAAWIAGDLPQTDDLIAREHHVVPLARGVDRHDSVPAEHRRDQAEPTREPTGPAAPVRGHVAAVRRDLLRRGGKLRPGEPGRDRPRSGRSRESLGAARRERSPIRGRRGRSRDLHGARPPRLHLARRG